VTIGFAYHSRRSAAPAGARHREHRHHQLGESVPARPGDHRLDRSQSGAHQLLQALFKEVGPQGIRVRTIGLRPVSTSLWLDGRCRGHLRSGERWHRGRHRRWGCRRFGHQRFNTPEEAADLVLLLASGRAGNVTGADFVIDGGLIQTF